ncbi:MAG: hypothetical protein ACRCWJ_14810 [Casimicrobium sp.]
MFGSLGFDGSAVDVATLVCGVVAMLVKPIKRKLFKKAPCWVHRDVIIDFLNGCSTVPFIVLILAVFSKTFLEEVIKTNKVSLMVSGMIGLLFVAREVFMENTPKNGEEAVPLTKTDV